MSVLSNLSRTTITTATLISNLINAEKKKVALQNQVINGAHQQRISRLNSGVDKWLAVRKSVGKASSVIHATVGRAKAILSRIDSMILNVNKAGQPTNGTTNTDMYAASFDAAIKSIQSDAMNASMLPNMIGPSGPKLTYKTGPTGTMGSVQGAFIGNDYYITDSAGKRWVPDQTAKNLKRYDNYPSGATNKVGAFNGGLRLDSISGNAITFTISPNTASPESFSGTLSRKGLRIMNSWYYNGLATDADRQQALSDLKSARVAVNLEVQRYQLAASTASFYEDRVNAEIKGIKSKVADEMIARATELQAAQDKLTREFQNTTSIVAHSLALKNEYAKMLAPIVNDKLTQALLNVVA
jgi:hypothetical protein